MIRQNQIGTLCWMIFAIYILFISLRLPLGSWRDPGPGFLPLGSGIFLLLLSIIDYFQADKIPPLPGKGKITFLEKRKNLFLVLGALIFYAIFLEVLGFLLTTFLMLFFLFKFIEPQKWFFSLGASALVSLSSYVVFELWLKTQLPKGFYGF